MGKRKQLYRSRKNRMIAGVCGGIGEYFGMDPTIVRVIAVLLLLAGFGTAAIVYIVLWAVVPEAPLTKRSK